MKKTHVITACAVGLALIVSACTKSSTSTTTQKPAEPAKPVPVTYTAREFSFEGPDTLPAGTNKVTLENAGAQMHQLIFVQLNKNQDWTAQDAVDFVKSNPNAQPKWAEVTGVTRPIKPDASTAVGFGVFPPGGKPKIDPNASLEPGAYLVMCFVGDPQSKESHAALGMVKTLTVA